MPEYIAALIQPAIAHPYLVVMGLLLLAGFGLPLPEDITIILAGYLAHHGHASPLWLGLWTLLWVVAGDSIIFFAGRYWGAAALRHRWVRYLLKAERQRKVKERFDRYGNGVLFVARFMPGLRTPIFFSAGSMGLSYTRLLIFDGGAALLSVPAIYIVTLWLGEHIDSTAAFLAQVKMELIPVFLLVGLLLIYRAWRKRRQRKAREAAEAADSTEGGPWDGMEGAARNPGAPRRGDGPWTRGRPPRGPSPVLSGFLRDEDATAFDRSGGP